MRLRIQTFSPLPEIKAWFIPELQDSHETVFDLKELLCKAIPQLRANQIHAQYLILLLEGFELLNDSPISAVRDGDLIVVKTVQRMKEFVDMNSELASESRKRKRNSNEFDRAPKKNSLRSTSTRQVSTTHQNVSASEASSSDSESDTSDSSSSTSSSESSPKTPPVTNALEAARPGKRQLTKEPLKQLSKTTNVPPGLGTPSTHSRNKRRKLKREYDKLAKAGPLTQSKGISETNKLPLHTTRTQNITDPESDPRSASLPQPSNEVAVASLSTRDIASNPRENNVVDRESSAPSSSSKYVHITPDQVMMGSLRNKNKKKGFKQSMIGPIPRKIVFSGGGGQQPSESTLALNDTPQPLPGHQFSATNRSSHRLVPPSELQDLGQLPPNVFVTSVDVENHIWGSHDSSLKNKKGKKRKHRNGYDDEGEHGFEEGWEEGDGQAYNGDLPYDDAQVEGSGSNVGIDWEKAEKLWEASPHVQDINQLSDGIVFGWKDLAINPQTFTPEILLFLARVIKVTHGTDRNSSEIHFRQLRRLGESEAAIAFGVSTVGSEEVGGGDDIMGEEECTPWSDVLKARWRLVDM